jgi:RNA recognition motif-containing protein
MQQAKEQSSSASSTALSLQPMSASHPHHTGSLSMMLPTQVLHVRNLPPDATEQDIMQLCKPFGRVVRLRLNAGAIKHQAFVEFENVNNAMQMIYSFVGSADPPKVPSSV